MFKAERYTKMMEIMENTLTSYKSDFLYDVSKIEESLDTLENFHTRETYFIWGLRPTGTTLYNLREVVFGSDYNFDSVMNVIRGTINKQWYLLDFNKKGAVLIDEIKPESIEAFVDAMTKMRNEYMVTLQHYIVNHPDSSQHSCKAEFNTNNYFNSLLTKYAVLKKAIG